MARDDPATLARAWELVAYFFGEGAAPVAEVSPAILRRLAVRHRLDAALAEPGLTAVSPATCVDAETWAEWQMARTAALARAVWRAEPSRKVFEALAPMPVIVLKGAAYAELLYPSPGARCMNDFDILVPAEGFASALATLERLGFFRLYPGDPTLDAPDGHERQLSSDALDLDLHQAFTQHARLPIDYGGIFARSLPWSSMAPNARLLDPVDAFVYHCVRCACGELTPEWSPAISLLDLRQMLRRQGDFWGKAGGGRLDLAEAVERARSFGADRMLYAALAYAARIFPSTAEVAQRAAATLSFGIKQLIDVAVVDRASPPRLESPRRPEVLLRKGLLLPPAARIRLLHARLPQIWAGWARVRSVSAPQGKNQAAAPERDID